MPVTWVVNDKVALNANLGADWAVAGARTRRVGVSGEWAAHEKVTVIAERVKFAGEWNSRLGTRFMLGDAISIDLSAARVGPGCDAHLRGRPEPRFRAMTGARRLSRTCRNSFINSGG